MYNDKGMARGSMVSFLKKIFKQVFKPDHPYVRLCSENYAGLLEKMEKQKTTTSSPNLWRRLRKWMGFWRLELQGLYFRRDWIVPLFKSWILMTKRFLPFWTVIYVINVIDMMSNGRISVFPLKPKRTIRIVYNKGLVGA